MFPYELDKVWIIDNAGNVGFAFLLCRAFLNNLLKNIPSLKGNTVFELVCGVMDSVIQTAKQGREIKDEVYNLTERDVIK